MSVMGRDLRSSGSAGRESQGGEMTGQSHLLRSPPPKCGKGLVVLVTAAGRSCRFPDVVTAQETPARKQDRIEVTNALLCPAVCCQRTLPALPVFKGWLYLESETPGKAPLLRFMFKSSDCKIMSADMKWRLLVYSYGPVQREADFTALTGLNSAEENKKDSLYSKGKFSM